MERNESLSIARQADCSRTRAVIQAEYTYDAFGKLIASSGSMADAFSFRYSTKYIDPETGFYYYGYRFYSPDLMRWITRDFIDLLVVDSMFGLVEFVCRLRYMDTAGDARLGADVKCFHTRGVSCHGMLSKRTAVRDSGLPRPSDSPAATPQF